MANGKGLVINVKRLITYLIVIAATIYTAVLYGSTSFLMLFYVELALPVFLLLTLIPAVRHTSIRGGAGTENAGNAACDYRGIPDWRQGGCAGKGKAAYGTEG